MRGLGAFQMAQMKHRDARVSAMCQQHAAIGLWEEIQLYPFKKEEREPPPAWRPRHRSNCPPKAGLQHQGRRRRVWRR